MLASWDFIKDSKNFPLDSVVAMIDWRNKGYHSDKKQISKFSEEGHSLVPVFSINDNYYVPKQFGKAGESAYPGMKETNLELFDNLQNINFTTIPIVNEVIENYEYGLVKWIDGSIIGKKKNLDSKEVKQILECGLELENKGVFHLDLNSGNILKSDRFYFVDPSLAKNHYRPKHDYFNERAITYHWSPEIINGGEITSKSSIYSLGKTLNHGRKNLEGKLKDLANSFVDENPENRPSFKEAYNLI